MPKAPTFPHFTDKYEPTNSKLWEDVLEVARGERRELHILDSIIHAPNHGRGFKRWPSKGGTGWCIKIYNDLGGKWKLRKTSSYQQQALRIMQASGVVESITPEEHLCMAGLQEQGLVRRVHATEGAQLWEASRRLILAGLGDDLRRQISDLLRDYNEAKAKALGGWFEKTFRLDSPKTPRGGKDLKARAQRLAWVLKHRLGQSAAWSNGSPEEKQQALKNVQAEVAQDWAVLEPKLDFFVQQFTEEGGAIVPDELQVGSVTYLNKTGLREEALKKYVQRLEAILGGLKGWRSKAVKGGLKVVLASPADFRGTAGGSYRQSEDALYVRTTPAVLKRGAGYASFEYILVHELAHRYEKYNRLPEDFDKPQWWTTRYSRTEGMGGSESFAELFALGHFHLTGNWDPDILDRFEAEMNGG